MLFRHWSLVVVMATSLVAPSCTGDSGRSGASDGEQPSSVDATDPPSTPARTAVSAPVTTIDSDPASTLQPDGQAVTPRDSIESDPFGVDGSVPTVDAAGSGGDDNEDFDPSFDLGPDVVLDVGVASFPVDDAGQGGPPSSGTPPASLPPATGDGWAGVDRYLESVLIRPGNSAASVAVSIGGEIVHRAAFGQRDPATGDPAEPQDRFRIASISKPITAIVALQLVEDDVIGIDDPIGELVADHVALGAVNSSAQSLTLRQLLTHTSGLGKFQGTFFGGGATDCSDAARQGLSTGASGGGYVYSNMNFCVVAMAIEALTGLSYEQAVYQFLLTPLGISGMRLAPTFDPGPDESQHSTTPGRNYMETLGGAGGWIATPSDLVTIFDSLDASTAGFKPLRPETVLAMVVPPGGQLGQRGYGLGMISYGGGRFGHTGTIESTHAMVLNRGDGVTWAITVAGQSPGESTDLERIMNDAFAAGGFVAS
jgi:D-alanyl-D-alanine carboxypeptidase